MLPNEEAFLIRYRETIPDCDPAERRAFELLEPMALTIYRIGFMEGQVSTLQSLLGRNRGARLN